MVVLQVSNRVFRDRRYLLVALFSGFGLLFSLSLLPHTALLSSVWFSDSITVGSKLSLLANLLASLGVNSTIVGKFIVVATSVLFGLQAALLLFYIRRRQTPNHKPVAEAVGLSGLVASLFGIGCAACGSVILTAALGLVGGTGLLTLLPLHGLEFGLLGLTLLFLGVWYLAKKINDPMVCPV
jgi:hypothetical protein